MDFYDSLLQKYLVGQHHCHRPSLLRITSYIKNLFFERMMVMTAVFYSFFQEVLNRILDLLFAPYYQRSILWILAPLLVTLFLTEIYADRYKYEQLGWGALFGNALI